MRIRYIIPTLFLSLFYFTLLFLALNPNVSEEYSNYYISKSTNLSPKQIKLIQPITPGSSFSHKSTSIGFLTGWASPEEYHRWSTSKSSTILIKITDPSQFSGNITIDLFSNGQQSLDIAINGIIIFQGIISSPQTLTVNFSNSILSPGMNEISLHHPNAKKPNNSDPRTLAIAIQRIFIS